MRLLFISLLIAVASASGTTLERYTSEQYPPGNLRGYFVKMPKPNYPKTALALHKKGKGWFRLEIDRATGKITQVKVLKSTGVKILDDSAAVAFMQWRAKPNMLDHAVLEMNFAGLAEETGSHIKW